MKVQNVFLFFCFIPFALESRVFITPEEALKDAFPNAQIEKIRIFLTQEDVENLKNKLNFKIKHRFYSFYVAKVNQKVQGYAILHTDTVRTKEMSLMVVLDQNKELSKFYLISFYEPLEYKPSQRWLDLITQKKNQRLIMGIDIPVIAGATLTARTVHQIVELTKELVFFIK